MNDVYNILSSYIETGTPIIFLSFWFMIYKLVSVKCFDKSTAMALTEISKENNLRKNLRKNHINMIEKRKELYKLYWNISTRILSTIHALGCVILSLNYTQLYYPDFFLFYFNQINKDAETHMFVMCAWIISYFFIDSVFMYSENTEDNYMMWIIHHTVGALGMFCFAYYKCIAYNAIYYAITEITTIFINISWLLIKTNSNQNCIGRFLLNVFGGISWVLWLIIRVLGIFYLMYLTYINYYLIIRQSPLAIFMVFTANTIMCIMNLIWFYKLTRVVFGMKSKEKIE